MGGNWPALQLRSTELKFARPSSLWGLPQCINSPWAGSLPHPTCPFMKPSKTSKPLALNTVLEVAAHCLRVQLAHVSMGSGLCGCQAVQAHQHAPRPPQHQSALWSHQKILHSPEPWWGMWQLLLNIGAMDICFFSVRRKEHEEKLINHNINIAGIGITWVSLIFTWQGCG